MAAPEPKVQLQLKIDESPHADGVGASIYCSLAFMEECMIEGQGSVELVNGTYLIEMSQPDANDTEGLYRVIVKGRT